MILHTPDPVVGLWSSLADAATLRLLAAARPGWLVLDAQHGTWSDGDLAAVLPVLDAPAPVWVRLADDRPAGIGRALDAGADGVIVPMVDSADQAAAAVRACRYPPQGHRSWGPAAPLVGRPAVPPAAANDAVRCAVMVETAAALAVVDAIAATPGLDMVFVGPFDLALALGRTVDDLLADAAPGAPLPGVVAACAAAGVRAGAFAGDHDRAGRLVELGFTDVVVGTDAGLLAAAAQDAVARWATDGPGTPSARGGY
ncbi:aldolase/citrate lyase family protein [Cellulomonas sp. Marseille-Q8402]